MIPKGTPPTTNAAPLCPITGRRLRQSILNARLQPAEPYESKDNPAGLNERIRAAGYNPEAYMLQDGAIEVLAYIVAGGERVATIEPSRNRGRFGGWQIVPMAGVEEVGIISKWEMPAEYELKFLV